MTQPGELDGLREHAVALGGTDRWVVPEPVVKAMLTRAGTTTPRRVCVDDDPEAAALLSHDAARAGGPLVLKAWGPGIVHKTELGAVRLGLDVDVVSSAVDEMRSRLAEHGLAPGGFLLEEQAEPGVEVLVGVIDKPPFGHMAVLGLGGTLAEVLDDVVTRLCPITREDAEQMVGGFRGAAMLEGYRSAAATDQGALADLLCAVAGPEGLVTRLGPAVAEFECNPVIVNEHGATIADARLILHGEDTLSETRCRPFDPDALFTPRSVAVVGGSTTRTTVANRTLRRYRDRGWSEGLYGVHPSATEIEGVPTYPSVADIPGGVDYLAVMLPAAACPDVIRSAGGHVKVVHVLSAGFGDAGSEGRRLEDDLRAAVDDANVRLIGPNSLGVYSPRGRQTFAAGLPQEPGNVGGVFQSGGLSGDVIYMSSLQGARFSKAVSSGNGTDLTVGELATYLVDDADTALVAVHVEGGADAKLIDALWRAKGRKPVVLLATGLSAMGSRTAASHTGSLTSDRRSWDAVSASTGTVVVETVDDFVAVLHHVARHLCTPVQTGPSLLVVGVGGGASVLAADACDNAGLELAPCAPEAIRALASLGFDEGTSLVNPVDVPIFQGTPPELLGKVVQTALTAQPFSDVLLHIDIATYYTLGAYSEDMPGVTHLLYALEELGRQAPAGARLCLVARNLDAASGADIDAIRRSCLASGIPLHRTFSEAALAIRSTQRLLPPERERAPAR